MFPLISKGGACALFFFSGAGSSSEQSTRKQDGESGAWLSCRGERLDGEGSGSLKVSEASLSHEGQRSNNLKLLRTRAPRNDLPLSENHAVFTYCEDLLCSHRSALYQTIKVLIHTQL